MVYACEFTFVGAVNVVKSVGEKIISAGRTVVNSIKSTGRKILKGLFA